MRAMRRVRRAAFALVLAALVHASVRAESPARECPPRAAAAIASVATLVADFGAPVVLVEAERPERSDDRRAVAFVLARLAECGVVTIDGEAFRARRREVADSVAGVSSEGARAALDRMEADFVLRVSIAVSDAGNLDSYGLRIVRRSCALAPSLIRCSDSSALAIAAVSADGGSASAQLAVESATQIAALELALAVTEAACADWRAVRDGARPWLVEFSGQSSPEDAMEALGSGDATLLEHVERGRTMVSASAASAGRMAQRFEASVRLRRPGFIRVDVARSDQGPGPSMPTWISIAAVGAVACVFGLWAFLRHSEAAPPS